MGNSVAINAGTWQLSDVVSLTLGNSVTQNQLGLGYSQPLPGSYLSYDVGHGDPVKTPVYSYWLGTQYGLDDYRISNIPNDVYRSNEKIFSPVPFVPIPGYSGDNTDVYQTLNSVQTKINSIQTTGSERKAEFEKQEAAKKKANDARLSRIEQEAAINEKQVAKKSTAATGGAARAAAAGATSGLEITANTSDQGLAAILGVNETLGTQ